MPEDHTHKQRQSGHAQSNVDFDDKGHGQSGFVHPSARFVTAGVGVGPPHTYSHHSLTDEELIREHRFSEDPVAAELAHRLMDALDARDALEEELIDLKEYT